MRLKSAWEGVDPSTIEKCFVKCGFIETAVEMTGDEVALTTHMDTLMADSGVTCKIMQTVTMRLRHV